MVLPPILDLHDVDRPSLGGGGRAPIPGTVFT